MYIFRWMCIERPISAEMCTNSKCVHISGTNQRCVYTIDPWCIHSRSTIRTPTNHAVYTHESDWIYQFGLWVYTEFPTSIHSQRPAVGTHSGLCIHSTTDKYTYTRYTLAGVGIHNPLPPSRMGCTQHIRLSIPVRPMGIHRISNKYTQPAPRSGYTLCGECIHSTTNKYTHDTHWPGLV